MDNVQDLLLYVYDELPNCPRALTLHHLKLALRDFCRDTEAWHEELDAIDLVADQTDYNLIVGWDASIHRILWVKTGGSSLATDPDKYSLVEDYTLRFETAPVEDDTDGLLVKVVLMPIPTCEELPEWFMDRWHEAIEAKAKSRLMLQKDKTWSDREMAMYYKEEYERLVTLAKMENVWQYRKAGVIVEQRDWA